MVQLETSECHFACVIHQFFGLVHKHLQESWCLALKSQGNLPCQPTFVNDIYYFHMDYPHGGLVSSYIVLSVAGMGRGDRAN